MHISSKARRFLVSAVVRNLFWNRGLRALDGMNGVEMTMRVDASRLNALIPQIVAFGRRTMQQQCVTSAAYIVKHAMDNTLAIYPDSIDARLGIKVISYTNASKNRISKAKRPTPYRSSTAVGKAVPLGVLVVMARMRPDSRFNMQTGGKWALPAGLLPGGPGSGKARQGIISDLLTRMIAARRSSSALLKSGWLKPLRILNESPYMVRRGSGMTAAIRAQLRSDSGEKLGDATIAVTGDNILVTCINFSTEGSNDALRRRHTHYAEMQALPPLMEGIAIEEANIARIIEQRLNNEMPRQFIDI